MGVGGKGEGGGFLDVNAWNHFEDDGLDGFVGDGLDSMDNLLSCVSLLLNKLL